MVIQRFFLTLLFLPIALAPTIARAASTEGFQLLDGDRVVLLGDTLIEREQNFGYLETRLHLRFPERNYTVRNLGWSGDTPFGESRAGLSLRQAGIEPPDEGWKQLLEQINLARPTVVFLGYGMASSFSGEAGLPRFKSDFKKLTEKIQQLMGGAPVRFVFIGPIRHEKLGPPLPDPEKHNQSLALYNAAIKEIAAEKQSPFINLFERLGDGTQTQERRAYTENGIHLSAYGYSRVAEVVEQGLGWMPNMWGLSITAQGKVRDGSSGIHVTDLVRTENHVSFKASFDRIVSPLLMEKEKPAFSTVPNSMLQFLGLSPGRYSLKMDGETIHTASDQEWKRAVPIFRGPLWDQTEKLRQAVIKKNQIFFHRSRPQNMAYLLGFRKAEQGKNAREIPQFDPLVQEQDTQIVALKKPAQHTFELTLARPADASRKTETKKTEDPAPLPTQILPHFEVAEGIEVNLFAQNPLLAKPIQMNFDPQGRLWVVSSSVYPQIEPGKEATDKVLILEDKDGDGTADSSQVFADNLLIPTGIEPGDGGVYVGQSTELLHLKDTDGDGKADQRRVVLSGFGTEDSHHILHTLRWGHDGQLYFNQSIYIRSHLETPHGVVRLISGGTLSLRPATLEVGIFTKGLINHWGHHSDEFGQSFLTDGAGGAPPNGIFYVIPGAMYSTYAGARRILGSISPGNYPKFCGLEVIYSDHFPAEWQGNMVTCDFRAHRVVRFAVSEKDSAYITKEMPDLLRTTNNTFRPIDVKLGPDGAIYVADWANPIIQHGEVDFRDPRRDHSNGRIWRITAKGRPPLKKSNFALRDQQALFSSLVGSNGFDRQQARRVLVGRKNSITNELAAWVKQPSEKIKLEGLWLYQSLDLVEPQLLQQLLEAKDGRIRAAAVRVASDWHDRVPNALALLEPRSRDPHPRVRLEAIRALSKTGSPKAAELVLNVMEQPMDPFLEYGLWLSINDLGQPWLESLESGAWKIEGRERQLQYALKALPPEQTSVVLTKIFQSVTLPRDGSGSWIELLAQSGGAKELRRLLDQVVNNGFEPAPAERTLKALGEAARLRSTVPSGDLLDLKKAISISSPQVQAAAIRLAGNWKLAVLVPDLLKFAADDRNPAFQKSAFESLREIGGNASITGLKTLAEAKNPITTRRQGTMALAALDLGTALPLLVEIFSSSELKENEALETWRAILNIKNAGQKIGSALPPTGLSETATRTGLRAAREGGRNEPDLVASLSRHSAIQEGSGTLSPEEMKKLVTQTETQGDAGRGERTYRRNELGCITCHAIGGVGGKVGPDMTSLGASSPLDYIIESILLPNEKIKEGYHSIQVQTRDDQEWSGILVRETTQELILRDASNKEVSLSKNNVRERAVGLSLMPSGLTEHLSLQERLDLFRFLSELGKPGSYDASRGNVARYWRLFPRTVTTAQFGDEKIISGDFSVAGWTPFFSLVDGRLLKEELENIFKASADRHPDSLFAAAQFETAKQGPVLFKLNPENAGPLWVNGKSISKTGPQITTPLPAGKHTVVIQLNAAKLPETFRLETSEGSFLVP